MHSTKIIAGLGLLGGILIFISSLSAETLTGEEPPSGAESHVSEESSHGETPLPGDEYLTSDETLIFEGTPLIFEASPVYESRSFDAVFSGLSRRQKAAVMSDEGLRYSFEKDGSPTLLPNPDSGIDLLSSVMAKKPSHVIEALVVVPYTERELDILDIYNALRKIKELKDHSIPWNDREIYIFTETTRLESTRNRKPIPDPPPADTLPYSETMYLRFIDPYMGDLYLRGDISVSLYGITYSMTNFRDVRYSIFRIMKAEKFTAVIYLEPVKEGTLVYSMSGIYLPGFIANRINLTPNINRRITVLLSWITDGLKKQESSRQGGSFYRLQKQ
ncbi:MAG: hypothetical protein LBH20_08250, partial [Treponema sp.]|jgi:hypothetical protein|nr:hypothetical protein [Treponema sp.]